jgi:hypothetical protein
MSREQLFITIGIVGFMIILYMFADSHANMMTSAIAYERAQRQLLVDDHIRKTYVIDGTKDVTKEELLELIKAIDARLKSIELQIQRARI